MHGLTKGIIPSLALLLLTWSSFAPSSAHAAIEIEYDSWARETMTEFLPRQSFKEAFPCGSTVTYASTVKTCKLICTFYCKTICDSVSNTGSLPNNFYVQNCSDDKVSIYSDSGLAIDVTKKQFEADRLSWFSALLENSWQIVEPISRVTVDSAQRMEYEVDSANGQKTKLSALFVMGTFYPKPKGEGVQFFAHLSDQQQGLLQVLSLQLGFGPEDDVFFRYKGVSP